MKNLKKRAAITIALISIISVAHTVRGGTAIINAVEDTAAYIMRTVPNPEVSPVGGEWTVLGLAAWAGDTPQSIYDAYIDNLRHELSEKEGILHPRKYTEYSRAIIALAALGEAPPPDMLQKLMEFEKTTWQGINGGIFALIALDAAEQAAAYPQQTNTRETRETYVRYILSRQLADGGFSLSGAAGEADITSMALQALSKYTHIPKVSDAVDSALLFLSGAQREDGGFESGGTATCESTAQALWALCELGIDPAGPMFVKNGNTLTDALLGFYVKGSGFSHKQGGEAELMSTEQAFCALVNYRRVFIDGKSSIYRMNEAVSALAPAFTPPESFREKKAPLMFKLPAAMEVPYEK